MLHVLALELVAFVGLPLLFWLPAILVLSFDSEVVEVVVVLLVQ